MPGFTALDTTARLPYSAHPHMPVRAQLRFDTALPYGVCLVLGPDGIEDGAVTWYFARELLNDGCYGPAGLGDVRVGPGRAGEVRVTLCSRAEQAVLSLPAADVAAFLHDSYVLVPPGTESDWLDLDAALARITA
ncbi:SsgA family sporulation/cell division regulator [Kitasatospora phosalacinea]|uniref:Sporulation protein SsgA n=1 Tax=Kitasatospora phosalacinea TaxID=2065 RepID=A0A9W6PKQ8_9ACTN|nr:SsgA family sporulation/cell division regulator [Kitasatospora phosalacinea]GLW56841.1 sporulation protein SsgA [Kitasatospora phosalacinea]